MADVACVRACRAGMGRSPVGRVQRPYSTVHRQRELANKENNQVQVQRISTTSSNTHLPTSLAGTQSARPSSCPRNKLYRAAGKTLEIEHPGNKKRRTGAGWAGGSVGTSRKIAGVTQSEQMCCRHIAFPNQARAGPSVQSPTSGSGPKLICSVKILSLTIRCETKHPTLLSAAAPLLQ